VQAVRPLPGPPGRPPGLFSRAQNSLFYHFFNSEFKYKSVIYVISVQSYLRRLDSLFRLLKIYVTVHICPFYYGNYRLVSELYFYLHL
jgi:hypothetical protein